MSSRGRGAGTPVRGGAVDVKSRRTASVTDMRAMYYKRLEEHVTRLTEAFRDVVRNAEVSDQIGNARSEFQIRVDASTLALAAEGILRLISELKVAAVVQDTKSTAAEAKATRSALLAHAKEANEELLALRDSVGDLLTKLEDNYYQSLCSVPFPTAEATVDGAGGTLPGPLRMNAYDHSA